MWYNAVEPAFVLFTVNMPLGLFVCSIFFFQMILNFHFKLISSCLPHKKKAQNLLKFCLQSTFAFYFHFCLLSFLAIVEINPLSSHQMFLVADQAEQGFHYRHFNFCRSIMLVLLCHTSCALVAVS